MALIDELPRGTRLALDTSALIYFMEEHPRLGPVVEPVFLAISGGIYEAVVSVISLLEVLVAPLRAFRPELAQQYRDLLTTARGLTVIPVTVPLAEQAASIRASRNLRVPDALIAATALAERCTHLLANDAKFMQVVGFRTLVVSEFAQ